MPTSATIKRQAFAYLRVSGRDQLDGDGFPRQREAIERYAAANGIEIARWFEERAVTGDSEWEDRPAWSAMVEALNGVRTIVVERLDRLARQVGIQEYVLRDLQKRSITLVTALGEETGNDDPVRVAMRQMLGVFAQYDKAMIVKKLKAARDRKKRETGRCEGRKAYSGEGLLIIREMSMAGASYEAIARKLNEMGIRPASGAKWWGSSVAGIVRRIKAS